LKLILISNWLGDTEAAWQASGLASQWLKLILISNWLGDTEAVWQGSSMASHWLKLILISDWLGDTEAAWQDSCLASYWLWPHHHSSHRQETSQDKKINGLYVVFNDFLIIYFIILFYCYPNPPGWGRENR
jgi:hypothetical protein